MQTLRQLLTQEGRYPSRRTWERRLKQIPLTLPAQIGFSAASFSPHQAFPRIRAAAIDSTVLPAKWGMAQERPCARRDPPHHH